MSTPLHPDELDLHAYADGQLTPEARRRVDSRLETDQAAKAQVDDYLAIRRALGQLYDPVLSEPVPVRLQRRFHRWQRPLLAAAASVFLLLSGTWLGWQLRPEGRLAVGPDAAHVVQEAAMAYAVYTPEVRHPVEVPGAEKPHLVAWLSKRLGAEVTVPALENHGFALLGGRLIASSDGPGALIMYENRQGQRVVLYLCENEEPGRNTAFRFSRHENVSVFYWLDGALSYAVAGELERSGLEALAQAIYREVTI